MLIKVVVQNFLYAYLQAFLNTINYDKNIIPFLFTHQRKAEQFPGKNFQKTFSLYTLRGILLYSFRIYSTKLNKIQPTLKGLPDM